MSGRVWVSFEVIHLVYEVLRQHSVGGRCQLSVRELAELTGLTHSTVHRALQRLRAYGMIEVEAGSYVGEANTIILVDPYGFGDIAARAQELAETVKEAVGELSALLPLIARTSPAASARAALVDEIARAVRSITQLSESQYAVIVDASHLSPDARRLLGITETKPDDGTRRSAEPE